MAATVQILSYHGSSPTTSTIANTDIRFKRADNDTLNALNPMQIPASGTNFSWRKHTKFVVLSAPDNEVSNLKFFVSASPTVGISHFLKLDPGYTPASSADEVGQIAGTINSAIYISTSPLTIAAGTFVTSTSLVPSTGAQNYLVHQIGVSASAAPGNQSTGSYTYRWDES